MQFHKPWRAEAHRCQPVVDRLNRRKHLQDSKAKQPQRGKNVTKPSVLKNQESNDAEDRLFQGAATALCRAGMAAKPLGPEEALINLDRAAEGGQVALLRGGDGHPETAEVAVHGLALQAEQRRRLRGRKVRTEAPHRLFDAISG
jgi:hypothetical protein